jgi:SAM-dependent methyltransferase
MANPSDPAHSENLAVRAHRKIIMGRRVSRIADNIAQLLPAEVSTVLDVGAGTGEIALAVLRRRPATDITGADVYIRPKTFIPVKEYDGTTLPFADNTFDAVMTVDVLHHCASPAATLQECARVAKTWVIIKDHVSKNSWDETRLRFMDWVGNRAHGVVLPYNYLSPTDWQQAFDQAGLTRTRQVEHLGLYPQPAELLFGGSLHCLYLAQKNG